MVDGLGAGSIIIDPSFVERRLHTSSLTSFTVHLLESKYLNNCCLVLTNIYTKFCLTIPDYRRGIRGVRDAAIFLHSYASNLSCSEVDIDPIEIAFNAAISYQDDREAVVSACDNSEPQVSNFTSINSADICNFENNFNIELVERQVNVTLSENGPHAELPSRFAPQKSNVEISDDSSPFTSSHGLLTGDMEVQLGSSSDQYHPWHSRNGMWSQLSYFFESITSSIGDTASEWIPFYGQPERESVAVEQMISDVNAVTRRPKNNLQQ